MGKPVAGNPAQYVMEKAFEAAGLDWRYLTLEVAPELLADAIRGIRAFGFRGANVMPPHKRAAADWLDELGRTAALVGAVNCISRRDDRLIGENTDGKGCLASLREATDPADKRVVIMGAGNVARAIAVELAQAGAAAVTIVSRSEASGTALAELLSGPLGVASQFVLLNGDYAVAEDTGILVHATPIGTGDAEARVPVDVATLRRGQVVADVVYNPPDTRLLRDAAQRGCTPVDGLGILVNQALIVFEMWTGLQADGNTIRETLEEFLGL